MFKKKFYITTSIAYTNAPAHVGFALETIQSDVIARYHRLLGREVFFLTGTDEHGRKVVEAAQTAGRPVEEFCDSISANFKGLKKDLNLSNDDFIRTTDQKRHWPAVKKVWQTLKRKGDIYKKKYRGLYCSGCEAFVTKKDLLDGKCAIHQKAVQEVEEENYFFRLSKYSKRIEKAIEKDEIKIVPKTRKNEMLKFVKQGLKDVSFSRPRKDLQWGIPVPEDNNQTIYCWADALTNYISIIGYESDPKNFKKWWPADVHCIGKDIQKFHLAIWPGMLFSLDLPLPKTFLIHGFITVGGQKMSKSLDNIVDPFELVKKYGTDAARYFLLREIPSTEDGDFTYEKFEKRYNADLASGLGNLVARVTTLAKNSNFQYPTFDQFPSSGFRKTVDKNKKACINALEEFKFNESLRYIWNLIGWCDKYIEKERPWSESEKQKQLIGSLLFALKGIAKLLEPFLPETSEKILKQLETKKSEPLFPRL